MTTLIGFAPEKGFHLTFAKFAETALPVSLAATEIVKNIEFFENAVRKGTYGLCESLYRKNEIRSAGYKFKPDEWFAIFVHSLTDGDYVTRYLPGRQEDYTVAQIDKWVREFDGESYWCVKPAMRYVPSLKDEDLYSVDPNARPTITNDSF